LYAMAREDTIDMETNAVISGVTFIAPCADGDCDQSVASPLSTLMAKSNRSSEEIAELLGLPLSVDLATFNPFDESLTVNQTTDEQEAFRAVEIANNQLTAAIAGFGGASASAGVVADSASTLAFEAVIQVLDEASEQGKQLILTNTTTLTKIGNAVEAAVVAELNSTSALSPEQIGLLISSTATAVENINEVIEQAKGNISDGDPSISASGAVSNIAVLQEQTGALFDALLANETVESAMPFVNISAVEVSANNEAPSEIQLSGSILRSDGSNANSIGTATSVDDSSTSFVYSLAGEDSAHFSIGPESGVLSWTSPASEISVGTEYQISIISQDTGFKSYALPFVITVFEVTTTTTTTTTAAPLTFVQVHGVGAAVGIALACVAVVVLAVVIPLVVIAARRKKLEEQLKQSTQKNSDYKPPDLEAGRDTAYDATDESDTDDEESDGRIEINDIVVDAMAIEGKMSSDDTATTDDDISEADGADRRAEEWHVSRSVRFLNQSLSTPAGQKTLENIANLYYQGDKKKAHAYLVYKLQDKVEDMRHKPRDSTTNLAKDGSGVVPESTPETTAFVEDLVGVMEEVNSQ